MTPTSPAEGSAWMDTGSEGHRAAVLPSLRPVGGSASPRRPRRARPLRAREPPRGSRLAPANHALRPLLGAAQKPLICRRGVRRAFFFFLLDTLLFLHAPSPPPRRPRSRAASVCFSGSRQEFSCFSSLVNMSALSFLSLSSFAESSAAFQDLIRPTIPSPVSS